MSNIPHHESGKLAILHTSDIHGTVLPYRYADQMPIEAGIAKISTAIKQLRRQYEETIYVDNGDLLQGTPLTYYHARMKSSLPNPLIACMNLLQPDAAVVGNHEFNYGITYLRQAMKESKFPWLSANLLDETNGEPIFGVPYMIKELSAGLKVGVLGLTTSYIPNWELPQHIVGIDFECVVRAAQRWVKVLREEEHVDLVVVSYHGGLERDMNSGELTEPDTGENEGYKLAAEVQGIDILLTGHQHRVIVNERIQGVVIAQPGSHGQGVGCIEVQMERVDEKWIVRAVCSKWIEVAGMTPDKHIIDQVAPIEAEVQVWLDQSIGQVEGDMTVTDAGQVRLSDHPLIEFINRVQMEYGQTTISNTALFDDTAPGFVGRITMRQVLANYIYANTLKVIRVTGQDIWDALEQTASYFDCTEQGSEHIRINEAYLYPKPQHYNYDMWEGIEYEIDISRAVGERITKLLVSSSGQQIDVHGTYDVAMNHYRAAGGGNYAMFANKLTVLDVPTDIAELIADYIMQRGTIYSTLNHNWRVVT
ncbi:bifunctional UDP-sugar hydrolase/5'-nucleotidase [Paenibacillus sp. UMB4589-SE434]|uniref:bifunctional metallophosphatase/5'-nucleotidase n=1 Tax=Paenibacillus sp. UMB4589-SE434 TaxID=3046314 RepID=UPI00254DEFFF|nr:bifunctional UDP-sugar hydrolase/5'-nucleotidase [Paenibacillus sp. UMB4589-SE434]MDK8182260.1 bifunctional UDP-sugar hydrolase/5'-nucleotidase [Paenibacillus sp. UMB4589-SE434]